MKKTRKRVFRKKQYMSGDGMVTSIWGPSMWHYLHTVSFNYPNKPTSQDKKNYRNLILNMQNTLPCGHCRENLKKNFKKLPLKMSDMKDRDSFSRYVYKLHELINKMLGKKSGLSFCDVRERYEHFRSRCLGKTRKVKPNKESGCTEPLYGKKAKCVIQIVPHNKKCDTMQIDKKCIHEREQ